MRNFVEYFLQNQLHGNFRFSIVFIFILCSFEGTFAQQKKNQHSSSKSSEELAEEYIQNVGDRPEPDPRPDTHIFGQKILYDLRAVDLTIKSQIVIGSGSVIEFDPENSHNCKPYVAIKVTYFRGSRGELGHEICAEGNAIAEALREDLNTGIYKVNSLGKNYRKVIASIEAVNMRTGRTLKFTQGSSIRFRPDIRCWGVVIEALETRDAIRAGEHFCLSRKWFNLGTRSSTGNIVSLPPRLAEIVGQKTAESSQANSAPARTHYQSELIEIKPGQRRGTSKAAAHGSSKNDRVENGSSRKGRSANESASRAKAPRKFDKKWLNGKKIKIDRKSLRDELRDAETTAFFFVPVDRCKAGLLQFGDKMCAVLARGVGELNSRSQRGNTREGAECFYAPENAFYGATPIDPPPYYELSLAGRRSNKKSYGKLPVVAMKPVDANGRLVTLPKKQGGSRNGFLVHSGREYKGSIEKRPTMGCLRIDPDCQIAFNLWVTQNPGARMKMEEISGSADSLTNDRILLERIFK